MEQRKLSDLNIPNLGKSDFPEELKDSSFEDWEDARKGVEEEIKRAINGGIYDISGGIKGAIKHALGPFYGDLSESSMKTFTSKAETFEKEFLERCPGLKEKLEKTIKIRRGEDKVVAKKSSGTKKEDNETISNSDMHKRGAARNEYSLGVKEDD